MSRGPASLILALGLAPSLSGFVALMVAYPELGRGAVVMIAAAALNALVGTYEFDNPPGLRVPISVKDGRLY